ncbi:MAG: hypothetical protein C3F08_10205 [Candidatus Methylomirabilota bacterium]|nr:MAG: hypothetical protein C3F08_10205 [candidate division NC10 bacterium]
MERTVRILLPSFVFGLLVALPILAGAGPIEERQQHQQDRIAEGVASGSLNPREATRLEREQAAIGAEKRAFLRDGKLGPAERAKLHRDQNRASRHIYKEKHD